MLASGRISEIFGEVAVEADIYFRTVNLKGLAEEVYS
jgi:acyl-homoserine lactone acylase PvdQ